MKTFTFFKKNITWLTFFLSAIVMIAMALVTSTLMISSAETIEASSRAQMEALSRAAALLVTAEELEPFTLPEDMETPEYVALKQRIIAFNDLSGTEYTYYLRLDRETNMMQFIIDNTPDEYTALSVPEVPREAAPDLALAGTPNTMPLGSYSDGWEGYMTAFAPVYYRDGTLSNIVAGVDAIDVSIRQAQGNMGSLSFFLILSMVLVLGACFSSLLLYQRQAKRAQIASEAKSSFLSRMSHEIRTPLNAIVGFCAMSGDSDDFDAVKTYLAHIDTASQHLRRVIDDVLDISKIESGKMALELIPASIGHEMTQIEQIIRPQTQARAQYFTVAIDPGVPEAARFDATHLRQVIVNLLSNAIKFTPENGAITLSLSLLETRGTRCHLQWCVEDTGIGISAEQQEKLFLPFEQADISTTRKFGGTGLGLSISKQLIDMMGGVIRIESQLGVGSKFSFNLWLEKIDAALLDSDDLQDSDIIIDLRGKTVLLVEDVETNQIIACSMLEKYGAEIEIADNGLDGYNAFAGNPEKYAMILMDVQMPVMDGYDATKKIRASGLENAREIPIVAMTANVYKEDVEKALAVGMNEHIGKPFDMKQIDRVFSRFFSR